MKYEASVVIEPLSSDKRFHFSKTEKIAIKQLSNYKMSRYIFDITIDWITIIFCMILSSKIHNPFVWMISFVIIATRQHALTMIMHDFAHRFSMEKKWYTPLISKCLLSWPFFFDLSQYQVRHLDHHRYLYTQQDVDTIYIANELKIDTMKTKRKLFASILKNALIGGFFYVKRVIALSISNKNTKKDSNSSGFVMRCLFYVVILGILILTKAWLIYLLLWLLPWFTLVVAIRQIRQINEHFGVTKDHELSLSRNFIFPAWLQYLVAPHNSGYHLDHHLCPTIPYYNLPRFHNLLMQNEDYKNKACQSYKFMEAFFDVLR